jgi:hypothetical protein
MNTWNDQVQYQMLLNTLNLNNNSLVGLPLDYYKRCFPVAETYTYVSIANGGVPTMDSNLIDNDITNYLLRIPFAADSSHMEGLVRTGSDINWATSGVTVGNPMKGSVGATIKNVLPPTHCVFTAVCDRNHVMTSNDQAVPGQFFSLQVAFNA